MFSFLSDSSSFERLKQIAKAIEVSKREPVVNFIDDYEKFYIKEALIFYRGNEETRNFLDSEEIRIFSDKEKFEKIYDWLLLDSNM